MGPLWKGAENLVPHKIRSPDCSAGSESLYRLRHSGPHLEGRISQYRLSLAVTEVDPIRRRRLCNTWHRIASLTCYRDRISAESLSTATAIVRGFL